MRSESEIRWVRARNDVNGLTKISQWHAIVPGIGDLNVPPGTACSIALGGVLQFAQHSAIKTLDGKIHEDCMEAALDYIVAIANESKTVPAAEPDKEFAAPQTTYTETEPRKV